MMLLATGTISAGKALMNTLIGMGTVFLVLIFISFIISLFKYINQTDAKRTVAAEPVPSLIPAAPSVEETEEAEEELVDDTELVAVITAAIAAYAGTSSEGFQVRSIKRAAKSAWK